LQQERNQEHTMKRLLLLSLLVTSSAMAQYKIVGQDGKVTYTDQPPNDPKAKVTVMNLKGNVDESPLPYATAEAVKKNPVTLITSPKCAPCDSARTMLQKRGIPFAERTVYSSEDVLALKKTYGAETLPLLEVGSSRFNGFDGEAWNNALTSAGYPQAAKLPPTAQANKPTSLAPPPPAASTGAAPSQR
jgi:glutaredoxin